MEWTYESEWLEFNGHHWWRVIDGQDHGIG